MSYKLDATDLKILNLLQHDCRMKIKDISAQLHLSTTPVFERIKKMEKAGIIDQYVALVNPEMVGKKLNAFAHISLKEHSKAAVKEFVKTIIAFPSVMECHYVTGGTDFILKVLVRDMEEYNHFIIEQLSDVPNIGKVESLLSLSVEKNTHAIDLG